MNRHFSDEEKQAANKYMKKSSTSLVERYKLKEHEISSYPKKNGYHQEMNNKCCWSCGSWGEEPFLLLVGSVDWCNHNGNQSGDSSKKTKTTASRYFPFSYLPEGKTSYHRIAICTLLFIAAQFVIAESQNQPKCPLMDKEDVIFLYSGVLLCYKGQI